MFCSKASSRRLSRSNRGCAPGRRRPLRFAPGGPRGGGATARGGAPGSTRAGARRSRSGAQARAPAAQRR
eukprot:865020-Alexandrium_andersonii.AAC.1